MIITSSFNSRLRDLDKVRKAQDGVIAKINKTHGKLRQTAPEKAETYGEKVWEKLRGFYTEAQRLAEAEERICAECLRFLSGEDLEDPKQDFRSSPPSLSSPATTATPSPSRCPPPLSVRVGDQVAGRVANSGSCKDDWILVTVAAVSADGGSFVVIDEEPGEEEEAGQRKYTLPPSNIIQLPSPGVPGSARNFPRGSRVLAVYPGTTALYQATVVGPPSKAPEEDYLLEFDGDEEEGSSGLPQRPVPYYFVVDLPGLHRKDSDGLGM